MPKKNTTWLIWAEAGIPQEETKMWELVFPWVFKWHPITQSINHVQRAGLWLRGWHCRPVRRLPCPGSRVIRDRSGPLETRPTSPPGSPSGREGREGMAQVGVSTAPLAPSSAQATLGPVASALVTAQVSQGGREEPWVHRASLIAGTCGGLTLRANFSICSWGNWVHRDGELAEGPAVRAWPRWSPHAVFVLFCLCLALSLSPGSIWLHMSKPSSTSWPNMPPPMLPGTAQAREALPQPQWTAPMWSFLTQNSAAHRTLPHPGLTMTVPRTPVSSHRCGERAGPWSPRELLPLH